MEVVRATCAGIDVHKRDVKVCLVWRDAGGQRHQEVRTFGTMTPDLEGLRAWLQEHQCRVLALESTGVYWRPVFNLLEGDREVLLVNPAHLKHVPGRKTDVKDCEWIAELLEHGLLKGSFIPPVAIRDLRDLTRYRRKQVEMRASEVNRLQKILELTNIKLASVATDIMGVSGRAMLAALLAGEQDTSKLAELSKGRLRQKKDALRAALQGHFRPHHAQLLSEILAHIDYLDESIDKLDAQIDEVCRPFVTQLEQLDSIPGVGQRAAQDMIAEIGVDMSFFPDQKHLAGWAHLCPGNNESGGKRKSGRTGKGNKWLRASLVECAQAAGRSKNTYLGELYQRFARRKGKQRAAIVVAHSMLEAAYFILRDHVLYKELGPQYLERIHVDQTIRYHVRRLEALGVKVDVQVRPNAELPLAV
jgi:transposase